MIGIVEQADRLIAGVTAWLDTLPTDWQQAETMARQAADDPEPEPPCSDGGHDFILADSDYVLECCYCGAVKEIA